MKSLKNIKSAFAVLLVTFVMQACGFEDQIDSTIQELRSIREQLQKATNEDIPGIRREIRDIVGTDVPNILKNDVTALLDHATFNLQGAAICTLDHALNKFDLTRIIDRFIWYYTGKEGEEPDAPAYFCQTSSLTQNIIFSNITEGSINPYRLFGLNLDKSKLNVEVKTCNGEVIQVPTKLVHKNTNYVFEINLDNFSDMPLSSIRYYQEDGAIYSKLVDLKVTRESPIKTSPWIFDYEKTYTVSSTTQYPKERIVKVEMRFGNVMDAISTTLDGGHRTQLGANGGQPSEFSLAPGERIVKVEAFKKNLSKLGGGLEPLNKSINTVRYIASIIFTVKDLNDVEKTRGPFGLILDDEEMRNSKKAFEDRIWGSTGPIERPEPFRYGVYDVPDDELVVGFSASINRFVTNLAVETIEIDGTRQFKCNG